LRKRKYTKGTGRTTYNEWRNVSQTVLYLLYEGEMRKWKTMERWRKLFQELTNGFVTDE
jgi:hypothetical protein